MLIGSIYGWEPGCDDIFDPNSPRNRDDCLEPFRVMRQYAIDHGIELHTEDVLAKHNIKPNFGLHIESNPANVGKASPEYLIRFETPLTVPLNADQQFLNRFQGIFTWDLDLLEGRGFNAGYKQVSKDRLIEVRTPNPLPKQIRGDWTIPTYEERQIFCCLIGSNRHANLLDSRELYSQRAKAIRWFEKYKPHAFELYGNGWRVPEKRLGFIGKMRYRLEKVVPFLMGRPVFPSYRGPAKTKQSVLLQAKFCICFENARDIRGYLTEKIFDCFFAGCIPVYWGDPDITRWVPKECFIDFREIGAFDTLYSYISNMSKDQYNQLQKAGQEFIGNKEFQPHTSEAFSKTVIDRILKDFEVI